MAYQHLLHTVCYVHGLFFSFFTFLHLFIEFCPFSFFMLFYISANNLEFDFFFFFFFPRCVLSQPRM